MELGNQVAAARFGNEIGYWILGTDSLGRILRKNGVIL